MNNTTNSIRKYSIITGVSLLIMAIAAMYSYGFVIGSILVPGNASQTLLNINNNIPLYYTGVAGWVIIVITDLIVSYALYAYFKDSDYRLSLVTGITRFVYTIILATAVFMLFPKDIPTFISIWNYGLILFGFHLVSAGLVSYKTKEIPKIIGFLLIVAGIGYTLLSCMDSFLPQYETLYKILETIMVVPMTAGELGFGIWLLVKGGKMAHRQFSVKAE